MVYFTGDSFSRKSRKLGSRSRRGSLLVFSSLLLPQNQPIGVIFQERKGSGGNCCVVSSEAT